MQFDRIKKYGDGKLWEQLSQTYGEAVYDDFAELRELPPDRIHHYTTAEALKGIIEGNCLWASAAYYLNDSSEIEYGCNLVIDALKEWKALNKDNDSVGMRILDLLNHVFAHPFSRTSRTATIYVTCFCENDNLLSQWRAYGKNGGYALGWNRETLASSFAELENWELRLAKVDYRPESQRRRLNILLRYALNAIGTLEAPVPGNDEEMDLLAEIAIYIQEVLLNEVVQFKNPAFNEEKEWRLIARPSLTPALAGEDYKPPFKFRASRGYLVPYLELKPRALKIPLNSIRFGPSLEEHLADNSMRMLLSANNFPEVDIHGAELPVIL